jgi:hypothetical protein
MKEWPELVGRSFMEVLVMFPDAIPLGVRRPDGLHMINPADDYVVQKGLCTQLYSPSLASVKSLSYQDRPCRHRLIAKWCCSSSMHACMG